MQKGQIEELRQLWVRRSKIIFSLILKDLIGTRKMQNTTYNSGFACNFKHYVMPEIAIVYLLEGPTQNSTNSSKTWFIAP